jgi:hypothetical protein
MFYHKQKEVFNMIRQVQLTINSSGFEIGEKDFKKKPTTDFLIDNNGIIREKSSSCPDCSSQMIIMNGYTKYPNKLFSALGINIMKGQYICLCCGCHYLIELPDFDSMNKDFKQFLRSLVTSLRLKGMKYDNIADVVHEVFNFKISSEHIRAVFNEVENTFKDLRLYFKQSGHYAYDAQHWKINGRPFYRHVVHDLVTGKVLIDVVLPKQCKKTITELFKDCIDAEKVFSFVVDMASPYPGIIEECFGKDVKIQWCLFHLYQDIRRKYKGCKKETDNSGFQNELNKQIIFDVYYPRPEFVDYLNDTLKWLKVIEKKAVNYDENKRKNILKRVRKAFWKQYRLLQKKRKKRIRKEGSVIITDQEELKKRFKKVYNTKGVYPTKIRKVIEKINDQWDKFIAFTTDKNIPPTNNRAEQYFSKTCKKTAKKEFRSINAAELKCQISYLQQNQIDIYKPFSIFGFLHKYQVFFQSCASPTVT